MSAIRIINCEQGTPEWLAARAGIPTASRFHDIVARLKSKPNEYTKARKTYLYELAGERVTGEIVDDYGGGPLARGKVMEAEARDVYQIATDEECTPVGFIINDIWRAGASPDSLIGNDGGLEVKSKKPALHIEVIEAKEIPEEHIAQCQGGMGITGRAWWDFISYWPKMKPFVQRVYRDEAFIAKLKVEIELFNRELDALVEKLK